jgi:hypothetical protein
MVILYIYSTCWRMKYVFYEHQQHVWSRDQICPEIATGTRRLARISPTKDLVSGEKWVDQTYLVQGPDMSKKCLWNLVTQPNKSEERT